MRVPLTILFCLLLIGCNDFIGTWDAWEIKKGHNASHRSGMPTRSIGLQAGRHMRFDAYFTNSCLYDTTGFSKAEFTDINKLYGFCDANSYVNENSTRIGWRHNGDGKIEIFAYWHSDGKFAFKKLGETVPYQKDEYELWARNGNYFYRFNNVTLDTAVRSKDAEHGVRFRLWPYFGGNLPAPNDIQIFIHEYN